MLHKTFEKSLILKITLMRRLTLAVTMVMTSMINPMMMMRRVMLTVTMPTHQKMIRVVRMMMKVSMNPRMMMVPIKSPTRIKMMTMGMMMMIQVTVVLPNLARGRGLMIL